MICPFCKKEVELEYSMIALDKPYLNLKLHKDCYRQISENLNENVPLLLETWYNIIRENNGKEPKKRGRKPKNFSN